MLAGSETVAFDYEVPGAPPEQPGGGATGAWITGAVVDPSAVHENARWVRIRADLVLDGLQGQEVALQARFQFSGTSTLLRDFDKQFWSTDGLVCSEAKIVPKYPRTTVTGMEVWIPVDQLHLAADSLASPLVALLTVVHQGRALASVSTNPFTVQAGGVAGGGQAAEVQAVWFTHNAVNQGQKGIIVHVKFTVSGCLGRDVTLATWFFLNGAPLKDFDRQFATADGNVCAWMTVRPIYQTAVFSDCTFFVPYDQLHMARGVHEIEVRVGVISDRHLNPRHDPVTFTLTMR